MADDDQELEDRRFIGKWKNVDGSVWTFDSDGTGSRNQTSLKFTFLEGKLILFMSGSSFSNMYDYSFSGEDNILFLIRVSTGINTEVIWLKKMD